MFKRIGLSLPLALATTAMAAPVLITNADFEDLGLACAAGPGCFALGSIPGWALTNAEHLATFKPSVGPAGTFPGGIPDGSSNVAAIGDMVTTASIFQLLSAVLLPDMVYTLSVDVGHRSDVPFSGYSIELDAGSMALVSSSALSPAAGAFLTDTLTFTTTSTTAGLGSVLGIRLSSANAGGQVGFDHVRLETSPVVIAVPEPASLALALCGLGASIRARRIHAGRDRQM